MTKDEIIEKINRIYDDIAIYGITDKKEMKKYQKKLKELLNKLEKKEY